MDILMEELLSELDLLNDPMFKMVDSQIEVVNAVDKKISVSKN